jgi:hypothetical protein
MGFNAFNARTSPIGLGFRRFFVNVLVLEIWKCMREMQEYLQYMVQSLANSSLQA